MTVTPARGDRDVYELAEQLLADGEIPPETHDAIVEFAEFLRACRHLGLRSDEPLPPNVMRRFRVFLGVSHAQIDEVERQLWRDEVARGSR